MFFFVQYYNSDKTYTVSVLGPGESLEGVGVDVTGGVVLPVVETGAAAGVLG